ncbi:MAG: long-chain fatty acid--CoA ligase [Magnetovibrio sp.]|nr:long-chain fatty acid--CoA ligase [Magnetovibrio sp.]
MDLSAITLDILSFIKAGKADDVEFNRIALQQFAYQFAYNKPFSKFARSRGRTPSSVGSWEDIPAVPINAFKALDLTCCPPEQAEALFMTSGTTSSQQRGKIYHQSLSVYDTSMRCNFAERFMGDVERISMGILFPTPEQLPNSSLAYYLNLAKRDFGLPNSKHLIGSDGIDIDTLITDLTRSEVSGEPYALLGASFSLVHALDSLERRAFSVDLPAGSRILDTGGFKGQSRELTPDEFYDTLRKTFNVPRSHCINMYGMTELSTQFYDNGNANSPSVKSGPSWIKTRVVNPLTGVEMPKGSAGVLAHTDLAHVNVVPTILTEDLGIETDDGFFLLGRAEGTESKGCSMAVDEFLIAAGSAEKCL